jgi:hypothetical protein
MRSGITAVELSILECTWGGGGAGDQGEKPKAGDSADN